MHLPEPYTYSNKCHKVCCPPDSPCSYACMCLELHEKLQIKRGTHLLKNAIFAHKRADLILMVCLRWRKQSYLKQRLQKSVWKECRLCSLCTDLAFGPSMLGVHSGGRAPGSCCSVSSLYLQKDIVSQIKNKSNFDYIKINQTWMIPKH